MKDWDEWKEFYQDLFNRNNRFLFSLLERDYTPIERIVYLALIDIQREIGSRNLGIYPQEKIGPYRVDFLLKFQPMHSTFQRNIVLECDGHQWHERSKEQAAKDRERDRYLQGEGYIILRYTGSEIVNDSLKLWPDIMQFILPEELKEFYKFNSTEVDF